MKLIPTKVVTGAMSSQRFEYVRGVPKDFAGGAGTLPYGRG